MAARDIDIGEGIQRIQSEQEDSAEGHWVKDCLRIAVIPSSREETLYFDRNCNFKCLKMPTSWHFRITFTRYTDGEVSTVATLRRTDAGPGSVDVQLCATVGPLTSDEVCARHFFKGMRPGQTGRDSARDFITRFDAERSVGQELPVEVFFAVNGCHTQQEMSGGCVGRVETMDTGDLEDASPRKREGSMDTGDSEYSSPQKRPRV